MLVVLVIAKIIEGDRDVRKVRQKIQQLGSIDKKIVAEGEELPAVTLKDGSKVQTGTVATMLRNVALYNAGERGEVEEQLKDRSTDLD